MKLFGILAASATAGLIDHPLTGQFNQWKLDHGKVYETAEINAQKFENWIESHKFVLEHNIRYLTNQETFNVELNHLADLTDEEFAAMNSLRNGPPPPKMLCTDAPTNESQANPSMVDWRKEGYVTPIKNQEACGSCWAFSTVGSMEGAHFKKSGKLVSLSEQNLVDCATKEGNHGCKGGLMQFGFTYIKDAGGIDTEESYPYTAKDGTCKFQTKDIGATIDSCFNVKQGDEAELENYVATVGPVSVAIDAHLMSFRLYKSGVYHDRMCSSTKLDHGVLAVGYNNGSSEAEDGEGKKYWIVKNSWGTQWGDEGFFWLAKDKHNMCGVATAASYPIAAS